MLHGLYCRGVTPLVTAYAQQRVRISFENGSKSNVSPGVSWCCCKQARKIARASKREGLTSARVVLEAVENRRQRNIVYKKISNNATDFLISLQQMLGCHPMRGEVR